MILQHGSGSVFPVQGLGFRVNVEVTGLSSRQALNSVLGGLGA